MTLKGFLTYSLMTNALLAGAVLWQEQVRAEAVAQERNVALDEDVVFRQHILRELSSDDPKRLDGLERLCQSELTKLKPGRETIWDPMR